MAHHTTVKNTRLVLLQTFTAYLNNVKNLGSDNILMPFYLKKIKLFLSFGYNQFHHTKHSLHKEQLNQELNAHSSN